MDYAKESLRLHAEWKGKIEVKATVPVETKDDLSLAYTPGVAQPCLEIQKDINKSYDLTRRWNLCAVITDGSAVLGLGDIGPEAGMPVMEGKCVLFKSFGDVDAFPLCVKTHDVDEFVNAVYLISGSFGGINLEDISAPRCFEIERKLKEKCDIPIFHDDQHGTAVITLAGLTNALKVVGKKKEDVKVVTSGAGAAIMDMLRILGKRYPLSKVVILPVRVQGAEAPAEIAGAIRYANKYQIADVIITGRGGGSMEDLWAFNDERVARAIFASEIPVVSAVGHEPDVTISDFVADVRAATPSNAAELVAPDQNDLRAYLLSAQTRMAQAMQKRLKLDRKTLDGLKTRRVLQSPINYVNEKRLLLDHSAQRLGAAAQRNLAGQKQRFIHLTAKLDALSPLKVLARGYSVVLTSDGRVVQRAGQVQIGDQVDIKLHQGSFTASVTQIQEERNGEEITEL